jgi:uncharacterized membrane protein
MLLTLHIVVASAWLGLIAGEVVIELTARDRATKEFAAQAHRIMDLYFEGPLVLLTLVTGSMLLHGLWPDVSGWLLVKVVFGLVAVVSNIVCIRWVVFRARALEDEEYRRWNHKVSMTKYAIPFAIAALLIGILL